MKDEKFLRYYYYSVAGLALLINDRLIYWALAVIVRGDSLKDGFITTFDRYNFLAFFLLSIFRVIPYLILISLVRLSLKKLDVTIGIAIGGLIGVLSTTIWGMWSIQDCYFTDVRCSSTQAVGFLILTFWAIVAGFIGSLVGGLFHLIYRGLLKQ